MSDLPGVLEQRDVRRTFESAGDGPWTVLYESWKDGDLDVFQWSLLAPRSLRRDILADINRLPRIDFGAPGFSQTGIGAQDRTQYERFGDDEGFEPLVIHQDHHGVRPPMRPQLSEEFRLYHNLWSNETGTAFFKVHDDGSDELAAEIGPESVRVRTPLLRQFQAAKQLDLVLRISSYQYVDDPDEVAPIGEIVTVNDRDNMSLSIHVADVMHDRQRPCSMLDGTKVAPAPPREKAGVWPFKRRDETYQEFIIGENADGEPIKHTCDPEQLDNYFDKNPGAPHYLTPVFFRRAVLKRYYEDPGRYSIEGSHLSCGGLWGLRLDNDLRDQVMVFLGDLGRDLPESERPYWQTFNVVPTGPPSRTLIRRALLGQCVSSEALDLRFKSTYNRFNNKWHDRFGWALFKEPEPDDAHVLQRLRIPLDDSQPEFESQIMGLAKLLVDALDEKEIQKRLPDRQPDERGIGKLKRWMLQEQYPLVERDIAFLKRLQHLRSKVTAHRKGSDYQRVLADENVNPDPIQEVATMLQGAERLLHDLAFNVGIDLQS